MSTPSKVKFFKSSSQFRTWLEKNHANAPELWLGFPRIAMLRRPSATG